MRRTALVLLIVSLACIPEIKAAPRLQPAMMSWQGQDQAPPPPDQGQSQPYSDQDQNQDQGQNAPYESFSPEQLDNLLSPIALYPDPLLAQLLVAATFPDQVEEAARWVRGSGQEGVDDQNWDVSVKAVAHYPTVIEMMADKIDWTTSLGQAYVNQSTDVSLRRSSGCVTWPAVSGNLQIIAAAGSVWNTTTTSPLITPYQPQLHLRSGL